MTPQHPERRHRNPGRRESDRADFAAGVLVQAVADEGFFPRWKRKDVAQWLGIIATGIAIYAGLSTWFATRFAARSEIEAQVKPVVERLEVFAGSTNVRLQKIEDDRAREQIEDEAMRALITGMARLQCLDYARQRSMSLADAAGLPCDSLLRRTTPR